MKPDNKISKLRGREADIQLSKDFYSGDVINKLYLPLLAQEDEIGWKQRAGNTLFTNLYAPVIDSVVGNVLREDIKVSGLNSDELDSIDTNHNTLSAFMKIVLTNALVSGLEFIAIQTQNDRVYLKRYPYSALQSYRFEDGILMEITFKEVFEVSEERFSVSNKERYMVYTLDGGEVWFDSGEGIQLQDNWSNSLGEVAVVGIFTNIERSPFEVKPNYLDVAQMNRVLLNVESSLSNVLTVAGNPIPVFYGILGEGNITLGVKQGIHFDSKDGAGFEFVEVTGNAVEQLTDKIKGIKQDVNDLYMQFQNSGSVNTTVEAVAKQEKYTSYLVQLKNELESKFNTLFGWFGKLQNREVKVEFNKAV